MKFQQSFSIIQTYERKCFKELQEYQGVNQYDLPDYMQQLFLNEKTKTVIICQMTSIRLFSLTDLKYVQALYKTDLNAAQFFYNDHFNYIIYTNKLTRSFLIIDFSNFVIQKLNIDPPPSKSYQSTFYRFWFLSDQQTYIYLNSNAASIQILSQQTHTLKNLIYLDQSFYPYSTVLHDEKSKDIFFIDWDNAVQHVSYRTNRVIFKYQVNLVQFYSELQLIISILNQLNTNEIDIPYKELIWDSFKQKLIVKIGNNMYVIGIEKQLIEFYFYDIDKIVQIQLIPYANLISVSSYYSCSFFDYDYLLQNNKETFPNQLHPRYYKINEDVIFHLNNYSCQANLFVNKKIVGSWIRNNQFYCYIRIAESDLSNLQVYALFEKEIVILDVNGNEIVQIDQYFLSENIIEILHEDNNNIFLYSQSQEIIQLLKKQQVIKVNRIISVGQGIAQYIFSSDSKQLLFTDQVDNTTINIIQFNYTQNALIGQFSAPLALKLVNKDFKFINKTVIAAVSTNNIRLYDLNSLILIKSVTFPIKHNLTNIKIDYENKRIFVQNRLSGSLIYDFNLVQHPKKRLFTFSNDLSFDSYFIYSVTSHSANIYFRNDLTFLINFRHFNSSLTLKKISYLGVGYIFMVEFITKLSLYEFSPITGQPLEKDFIYLNQFNIIKQSLSKLKMDQTNKIYLFEVIGFTQEGMFEYSFHLDIFSEISDSCSLNIPLLDSIFQESISLNRLTQLLKDKNIKLENLQFTILSGQVLQFFNISDEIISTNFGITISSLNGQDYLQVSDSKISQNSINNLQLKKIELRFEPKIYQQFIDQNKIHTLFEINKILFPSLTHFFIDDVILNEVSFLINDIKFILIKKITIKNSVQKSQIHLRSTAQIKIDNSQLIEIDQMIIENMKFDSLQPLFEITDSSQVVIKYLKIKDNTFQSLSKIISFLRIEQLEIIQFEVIQNQMDVMTTFLFAKQINLLKITNFVIKNLQLGMSINDNNSRILENDKNKINRIIELEEIQFIQIENFQMDFIFCKQNTQLKILSIKKVGSELNINKLEIFNIQAQKYQQGIIFFLKGINTSSFKDIKIESIQNLQILELSSSDQTEQVINICYRVIINNIQISKYNISQTSIIDISSKYIKIQDFSLDSTLFDENSNSIIPAIKIKAMINLELQNLKFHDINQFNDSVIQIYESANIFIQNSSFRNINSYGLGSVITIFWSNGIIFSDNIFQNNESKNGSGGALFCEQSLILSMSFNQFNFNKAINGSGGAILLNNCDIEKFMYNIFYSNSAFIGGSIRYLKKKPLFLLNNDMNFIKKQNTFIQNKYIAFGKDIGSYPSIIDVKNVNYHNKFYEIPIIENVQSGYKSIQPLEIRFIDEEMREVYFADFGKYNDVTDEIKKEFPQYSLQIESQEIRLLGSLKQSYNQEKSAFVFDASYSFLPQKSSFIKVKSTQLLPYFPPNTQMVGQKQFEIEVQVNFRECQVGEVLLKNGKFILCFTCGFGNKEIGVFLIFK